MRSVKIRECSEKKKTVKKSEQQKEQLFSEYFDP